MANLRDISRRMSSIQATMQVTRTMEMVSTAKIRSALDRAEAAGPYKEAITTMLSNVAHADAAGLQPLLRKHLEMNRVLYIVMASDRGLAGGFNVAPARAVLAEIEENKAKGIESAVITCGKKPTEFFTRRFEEPRMSFTDMSTEPTMDEADRIASYVMDGYKDHTFDLVKVVYHHAKNRVEQVMVTEQLLPVVTKTLSMPNSPREAHEPSTPIEHVNEEQGFAFRPNFEFDPSAAEVLAYLIPAYVRTVIYHALVDSAAAEHGARRRAMQNANDNADEAIKTLGRTYNRVRQGSITTELNEIVSGAAALEDEE